MGDPRGVMHGLMGWGRRSATAVLVIASGMLLLGGVVSASSAAAATNPTLAVSPNTGLSGGSSVKVTGSGYAKNSIGNVLECNDDPNQPTVTLGSPINSSIPVSCTAPSYGQLVETSSTGTVSTTYTIVQGATGPPCGTSSAAASCPATDSAGNSPSADAAKYPCPPTAAEEAANDSCELTYGDQDNDSASATFLFTGESPPGSPPQATPFHITTTSLPDATRGAAYSVQLEAADGAAPYKWKKIGKLPKGLHLHGNGLLSGTPKTKHVSPGTYTFTAQATTHKSKGNPKVSATQSLTLQLN